MKKIAVSYFEGAASPEEEVALFRFIEADSANAAMFKEWEREWIETHVPSKEVLDALNVLKSGIRKKSNATRIRSFMKYAAAVVVAAAISIFAVNYFSPSGSAPQMFYVEAPQGTNSRISLPDGTEVWLNAGSVLSYDSDFNRSSRNITLEGEAYFEVARNTELPFVVTAQECLFTVLGTKFNISAYDGDGEVLAALMEGSLKFQSSVQSDVMTPGDLIIYDCTTKISSRRQVDTDQYKNWIDGIIRYDAITLPALLKRLSREYNVNIELCTTEFDNKTFRVSLTDSENIENIMNALGEILPISVEQYGYNFRVNRKQD